MKEYIATVKRNNMIADNIYIIALELPEDAGAIHGGQFVNLSTGDNSLLLRRPLGVCVVEGRCISVCYQIKGKGTKTLSQVKAGEKLNVLLPLGNWFDIEEYKNVAVIGGGVGIFPLIATIREHFKDINFYSYIGFRNKAAVCLVDKLERSKKLVITTDDGSYGRTGNALEAFFSDCENIEYDAIIACGPPIMLKILKHRLEVSGIEKPCFVSLEERMGCGIGACLVCACKKTDGTNARVCKDGPVFNIKDVEL